MNQRLHIKSRTRNIIIAGTIFMLVLGSLFYYNWVQYQEIQQKYGECHDSACLRIYGNIPSERFIGISELMDGTFARVENITYFTLNSVNNTMITTISAVLLWDILEKLRIDLSDVQYLRFESSDGYKTFEIPISLLQKNHDAFFIITQIDGKPIAPQSEGGDGPLKSGVIYTILEESDEMQQIFEKYNQNFVHNSKFNVKYLDAIKFY
ncbi:MAG: hypothetical protein K9W44_09210 [Candidatus Lokiarchaeota archaeon]|nr:hypothetical protein [Candidatus Harpocratesius repetitus]